MTCIYQTVCSFSFHSTCKPLTSRVNPEYLPRPAYVFCGKVIFSVTSVILSVHKGVGLSPCDHYGLFHGTPSPCTLGTPPHHMGLFTWNHTDTWDIHLLKDGWPSAERFSCKNYFCLCSLGCYLIKRKTCDYAIHHPLHLCRLQVSVRLP